MENEKVRLQKYLSECGVASRRRAEELILKEKVTVNGSVASIGDKISPKADIVLVNGKEVKPSNNKYYIMLNKPRGYVSTTNDEKNRKCVTDLITGISEKIYPVGRLDKDSEGLIFLTNDGDFANKVIHPAHHFEKKYRVTTHPEITEDQLTKLCIGVNIDGKLSIPHKLEVLVSQPGRSVLEITLKEGRNRQIRKMCESVGLNVARLKRVSIGQVKLGMLKIGQYRELTINEVKMFK